MPFNDTSEVSAVMVLFPLSKTSVFHLLHLTIPLSDTFPEAGHSYLQKQAVSSTNYMLANVHE